MEASSINDNNREESGTSPSSSNMKTKQQKKEEGRRRALEIAMAKQQQASSNDLDDGAKSGRKSGKRATRKSARHGARNQHRHKHFAKWILDKFPHIVEECSDVSADGQSSCKPNVPNSENRESTRMHILDVAGGKGELSARLSLCHSLNVIMIDPRPADIASVYTNSVVPKLPNKWQASLEERLRHSPTFVQDKLETKFSQLVMPFTSPAPPLFAIQSSECEDGLESCCYAEKDLDDAVRNASVLIGLHADGATEAIVDAALLYQKPFVVVPCCVFPNLFRERYISVPIDDTPDNDILSGNSNMMEIGRNKESNGTTQRNTLREKRVPVRTHDQFCKYLLDKDPRFVMEVLPFEGRNIAIWWDGK
mmetsp:Transcript_26373/g.45007  ORF Transcript_26373/g.45007 Transcript_26373/m.45007 type:complete len:366 (+) Transcript_26373:357-1454(+)